MTTTAYSNHGDNESIIGLTTPSSTQASSPSASPALSLTDDRKEINLNPKIIIHNGIG